MSSSGSMSETGPSFIDHRAAGVLLHPSSLPGSGPIGDLGKEAYRFVDFLSDSGMSVWQVLPLNEPHGDGSPYQGQSAHAGDIRLISWHQVHTEYGLGFPSSNEYGLLMDEAFNRFAEMPDAYHRRYESFCARHAHWLEDYALYHSIRERHDQQPWWTWEEALRDRHPEALAKARINLRDEIKHCRFSQFIFFEQWHRLRDYANNRGIKLFGDMPIFVAHDSADVWVYRDLFELDEAGNALSRSGVPPDYFSANGQLWGNPLYHWDRMQSDGFSWWKRRFATQLELYDFLRVDHFRGFDACWSVPMGEDTAVHGHWVDVPGRALFASLLDYFGKLPIVAEDLGVITSSVEALRDDYALPGMKILQFAFDSDAHNPYLPHNHVHNCVVYTGTHDNDTSLGWFQKCAPETRQRMLTYLGHPAEGMPYALIRSAFASVARLAIVPMQDLLGLDSGHRMNTPGTCCESNWRWRFTWDQCPDSLAADLRTLAQIYGRM